MRSHLCNTAKSIKEQLRVDLQKRLITILFDIGSRAGRSFLGVGAQYMDKFVVKIVHLGIVVMHEKKTAVNLYQRIKAILDDFGISMDQIYNITTDNGANVIRASNDMLKAVALQVAESLEETDYENCQNAEQDDMDHGSSSPPQGDQNDFGTRGEAAQYDDETDEDDEESDDDIENVLITMMESGPYEGSAALTPTRCAAHTIQLAVHDALAYWSTEVVVVLVLDGQRNGECTIARLRRTDDTGAMDIYGVAGHWTRPTARADHTSSTGAVHIRRSTDGFDDLRERIGRDERPFRRDPARQASNEEANHHESR